MNDGIAAYKCPACGASLSYSAEYHDFYCEYCGSHFTKDKLDKDNDIIIDVRPKNDTYPDLEGFAHYFRSPVSASITPEESTAFRALFGEQKGNGRVVIVCIRGIGLAKSALADLQAYGADMKNVTYLIGGATGLAE